MSISQINCALKSLIGNLNQLIVNNNGTKNIKIEQNIDFINTKITKLFNNKPLIQSLKIDFELIWNQFKEKVSKTDQLSVPMISLLDHLKWFFPSSLSKETNEGKISKPKYQLLSAHQAEIMIKYPQAISVLFDVLDKIRKGEYGERIQKELEEGSAAIFSKQGILIFLLYQTALTPNKENALKPEMFTNIELDSLLFQLKGKESSFIEHILFSEIPFQELENENIKSSLMKLVADNGKTFSQEKSTYLIQVTQLWDRNSVEICTLCHGKKFEKAEEKISKIEDSTSKTSALLIIGAEYIRNKKLKNALEIIEQILPFQAKILLQSRIVDIYIENKQLKKAIELTLTSQKLSDSKIPIIIYKYLLSNQISLGLDLITKISKPEIQQNVYLQIIQFLTEKANQDNLIQAKGFLEKITLPTLQAEACLMIFIGFIEINNLEEARNFGEKLQDLETQSRAYLVLANAFIKSKDLKNAEEIIEGIKNPELQSSAYLILIKTFIENKCLTKAETLAQKIDHSYPAIRSEAFLRVIQALLKNADLKKNKDPLEKAKLVAENISDSEMQSKAYLALLNAFTPTQLQEINQYVEKTRDLIEKIEDPKAQTEVCSQLIILFVKYADLKDLKKIEQLSEKIRDSEIQSKTYLEMVSYFIKYEQLEKAENLSDKIVNSTDQSLAQLEIIRAFIPIDLVKAEELLMSKTWENLLTKSVAQYLLVKTFINQKKFQKANQLMVTIPYIQMKIEAEKLYDLAQDSTIHIQRD